MIVRTAASLALPLSATAAQLTPAACNGPPPRVRDYIQVQTPAAAPPPPHPRVLIEDIKLAVCDHFGLALIEMTSQRRSVSVARPRQLAMYLARKLTPRSYPEIGAKFGGRDHTTVMHAVNRITQLIGDGDEIGDAEWKLSGEINERARFRAVGSIYD